MMISTFIGIVIAINIGRMRKEEAAKEAEKKQKETERKKNDARAKRKNK